MNKIHSHRWPRTLVTALAAAWGLLAGITVPAATDTWTGGGSPDGNWQTAANWGGAAPGALDQLIFAGNAQTLATNNFSPGTIFTGFSFDTAASSFLLSGNSLVLTNGADAGGGNT